MRTWRRQKTGGKGLTLLEVLITLSVLSLIALIASEAVRLGSRSWQRGEQQADEEQRVRVLYGILAGELASIQPVMTTVGENAVVAFQGGPDWIFFHTSPTGGGPLPRSAMVRGVAYAVDPGRGLIIRESYPLVEGVVSLDPRGEVKVLDPRVKRLAFRYLVPPPPGETDPKWVDAWDPRQEVAPPEVAPRAVSPPLSRGRRGRRGAVSRGGGAPTPSLPRLPLAVEITLVTSGDRRERETGFLLPIQFGRSL